jgi:hypothetical protein
MERRAIKRETLMMSEAYTYYLALGDERSISKVAAHVRKSCRTVEYWSESFNWAQRIAENEREIAEQVFRRTVKDIVDSKVSFRKIIKIGIKNFVDNLTAQDEYGNAKLKIATVADLEKLIKLDLLLMNQYTEVIKVDNKQNGEMMLTQEDREYIEKLCEAMRKENEQIINEPE